MKGHDLGEYYRATGDGDSEVTADDIRKRAEARIRGISEEQLSFEEIGIGYEEESEDEEQ